MEIRRNIEIGSLFQSSSTDFSLLDVPYITCVDAEQEFVVIYNPRNEYFALDHYSIADGKMHHTFKFPRRCKIPPRTEYCIYTCPGAQNFDHGSLMEYHVLWTNHDGSLRRMEVLNNGTYSSLYVSVAAINNTNFLIYCREMLCQADRSQRRNHFTMRSWYAKQTSSCSTTSLRKAEQPFLAVLVACAGCNVVPASARTGGDGGRLCGAFCRSVHHFLLDCFVF